MRQHTLERLDYRALASRCRRVSEYCYEQMRQIYTALNISSDPTWFAYISHLQHTGGSTIQHIANELGISQPAASKMIKKLEAEGFLHTLDHPADKRIRHVQLTPKAIELWHHICPSLDVVNQVLSSLDTGENLLDGINQLEQAFAQQSFKERVLRQLPKDLPIDTRPYTPSLQHFYEQHNRAWVSKYFHIEPIDEMTLGDPHTHVLAKGGEIYIVHVGAYPIGGFSLIPHNGQLELSKMYVPESLQGYGYGDIVLQQSLVKARSKNVPKIFLMSNRSLTPAIRLYQKHGFTEVPLTQEHTTLYTRVNIVMEYNL